MLESLLNLSQSVITTMSAFQALLSWDTVGSISTIWTAAHVFIRRNIQSIPSRIDTAFVSVSDPWKPS
jgi:hypothetical protein